MGGKWSLNDQEAKHTFLSYTGEILFKSLQFSVSFYGSLAFQPNSYMYSLGDLI